MEVAYLYQPRGKPTYRLSDGQTKWPLEAGAEFSKELFQRFCVSLTTLYKVSLHNLKYNEFTILD